MLRPAYMLTHKVDTLHKWWVTYTRMNMRGISLEPDHLYMGLQMCVWEKRRLWSEYAIILRAHNTDNWIPNRGKKWFSFFTQAVENMLPTPHLEVSDLFGSTFCCQHLVLTFHFHGRPVCVCSIVVVYMCSLNIFINAWYECLLFDVHTCVLNIWSNVCTHRLLIRMSSFWRAHMGAERSEQSYSLFLVECMN